MSSVVIVAGFAVVSTLVIGASAASQPSGADRIARGRYLVHQVAMCVDCHSPRGETGAFIEAKHLTGSPLGFAPTVPMPAWAPVAPSLAGLPTYSDEQAVEFLMTGRRPHGLPPTMPPMPVYNLDRADAEAVVAYLRSLNTAGDGTVSAK